MSKVLKNKEITKLIKKGAAVTLAGMFTLMGIFGGTAKIVQAADKSEPGEAAHISYLAKLTDGRTKEKTTASLYVTNGPNADLTVKANIYYRFDKRAYYWTSGEGSKNATSYGRTASAQRTPVTVDRCYGTYRAVRNGGSWVTSLAIGDTVTGYTYKYDI